jgi:hypothetical protein
MEVAGACYLTTRRNRREIIWDAPIVSATVTNNDAFPGDFFNTVSPRGVSLRNLDALSSSS